MEKVDATHEQLGALLDALYLQMFNLIEQHTACRAELERRSNAGQLLLAKTRYVQGSQTVSAAQLPTENSNEFKALCRIQQVPNNEKIASVEYAIQNHKVDKNDGYVDPLKWFGILSPQSLQGAAKQYKTCLELTCESANLQRELMAVMNEMDRLKQILI